MAKGKTKPHASAQGRPRASAGKNQIRRTQRRAKRGAAAADKEAGTVGEIEGAPEAGKTKTTVAGTGDKICGEAVAAVASTGTECERGAAWQQAILP